MLYMAFKNHFAFATDSICKLWLLLIQNHAKDHFHVLPAAIWSSCAVTPLFYWNLSRHTFLRQVIDSDLQLRILFLCLRFCSRHQWIFERLSEAISASLVCNKFSRNPFKFKISFYVRKNSVVSVLSLQKLQSIETLLTLKLLESAYCKSGSTFPKASLLQCRQNLWLSKSNLPLSSGIPFGKTSSYSNLDSNLNSATWPTCFKGFICS